MQKPVLSTNSAHDRDQIILPFLRKELSTTERLMFIRQHQLWDYRVQLERTPLEARERRYFHSRYEEVDDALSDDVVNRGFLLESLLDLNSRDIQTALQSRQYSDDHLWYHVNSYALSTPLGYLPTIFDFIGMGPGERMLDVGSGYGNVGYYVGAKCPELHFEGFEIVFERMLEAQRVSDKFGFSNVNFGHADVLHPDFILPQADVYYLYDPLGESELDLFLPNWRPPPEGDIVRSLPLKELAA